MLVFARKKDDRIMIGDNIEILIVSIDGDRVKLGINAPRGMPVHRGEVYQAIQNENKAALSSAINTELLRHLGSLKGSDSAE